MKHLALLALCLVIFPALFTSGSAVPVARPPPDDSASAQLDPDSKLYLAIRFFYPELLSEALAEGANIDAIVPPMKVRHVGSQRVYEPAQDAPALPMFVHAFNYGNLPALQLLADRGARFEYRNPRPVGEAPGAGYGDYAAYALYCPDQRRVMVDGDGLPTGQFAGCYDLYRTLVSGGYRFNRYDMRKMLQGQGWQFWEKYRYMRAHADPEELAAFDQSDGQRVKRIAREQTAQHEQVVTAQEYQQVLAQGQRLKKRADKLGKSLFGRAAVGETICKRGDFHYTSPYHYQVEHLPGVLVATLEEAYPAQREIRFRIAALHTESGQTRYFPSHPPRFDGMICVPGWTYLGDVKGWYPCATPAAHGSPANSSW